MKVARLIILRMEMTLKLKFKIISMKLKEK
jgi:hypothetical protein